jgi:hypothetical protein
MLFGQHPFKQTPYILISHNIRLRLEEGNIVQASLDDSVLFPRQVIPAQRSSKPCVSSFRRSKFSGVIDVRHIPFIKLFFSYLHDGGHLNPPFFLLLQDFAIISMSQKINSSRHRPSQCRRAAYSKDQVTRKARLHYFGQSPS